MPIRVSCPNPNCSKVLNVKGELAGKRVKCPECQTPIEIPAVQPAPVVSAPVAAVRATPAAAAPIAAARPQEPPRSGVAGLPEALLKHQILIRKKRPKFFEGFIKNPFVEAAKVTHTVEDYETKQVIGFVRKEREEGFDWKKRILGVQTRPERYDVRETENGPNLLSVLIYRPLEVQLNPLALDEKFYEIRDAADLMLGRFRMKQKLFRADFSFRGPDDQVRAEVKWNIDKKNGLSSLVVVLPNGQLLGRVVSEGTLEAEQRAAAGKMVYVVHATVFSNKGHLAEVAPDLVGKPPAHLLTLGLAVIVMATGFGKSMTQGPR